MALQDTDTTGIVPDAPHSTKIIYEKSGIELMQFHDRNFGK